VEQVTYEIQYLTHYRPAMSFENRKKQTDTDGLSKTTFLDVFRVVYPKSGLISKSIFSTMPILTNIDMEVIF